MSEPIRIRDAAAICGVSEDHVLAAIKQGKLPRYGVGVGKVKVSDVFRTAGIPQCPTCGHVAKLPAEEA